MTVSHEERFSALGFQRMVPSLPLRPYILWFWYFNSQGPLAQPRQEFMHPEGGFGIIVNLGDHLQLDTIAIQNTIYLDGTSTISRKVRFAGTVEAIGIRFRTGGAFPILGIPLHHLANQPFLLSDLASSSQVDLYDPLYEAPSITKKVGTLEAWLLKRLHIDKPVSPLVTQSLKHFRDTQGRISPKLVAQDAYVSQRHLERLYHSHVGMTPKEYSRLLRVQQARHALKGMLQQSITDIGMMLDYYDYAHFTHEFKSIVGMTPHQYVQHSQKI